MSTQTINGPHLHPSRRQILKKDLVRQVEPADIGRWLVSGWADLKQNPTASVFFGVVFALLGMLMHHAITGSPVMIATAAAAFLLAGPFLAVGLYDLSEQIEEGRQPRLMHSLHSIWNNKYKLAIYAMLLGTIIAFWVRTAGIVAAVTLHGMAVDGGSFGSFFGNIVSSSEGFAFLTVFSVVAALFMGVAFITGVVTLPSLLYGKLDIVSAGRLSLRAVLKNPRTMALWALTIFAIIGLGIATWHVGLIIAMPLIAHASWHAYRALIDEHA